MVAVADFATVADMESRTRGKISYATHPFLPDELAAASQAIRDECGWHIAPAQPVTERHRGAFVRDVWLQAMEVASITSATIDGEVVDVAAIEFDPGTGWTNLRGRSWEVTYVAGFEEIPAVLVTLTLQVTARALGSPLGIVREQIGQHSATYSQAAFNVAGGTVLLAHEKEQLARYRIGPLP